ncbi:MAG: nickel pincer cofactor biosynthesis protein LarC [Chthoniobacteraceae bacterium]
MTVGALCDLGVPPSVFEWELGKVNIGDFHMHFERKQRQAIEGVKFGIHEGATHRHDQDEPEEAEPGHHHHEHHGEAHEHAHGEGCGCGHHHHEEAPAHRHEQPPHRHEEPPHHHAHEHQPHAHGHEHHHHHEEHAHPHGRNHAEIRQLISESDLSDFVKKHALSIFQRIAVAEGKIHGVPAEDVTFHEVGALDSIADIICACVGIEHLKVDRVQVSPLFDGHGWVDCAHGRFPIPAAATLEILHGIPFRQIDEEFEFITPTGAAIAAEFGASFGPMPALKVEKIGYGVGTKKLKDRPNVLRAILGEAATEPAHGYETDTITCLETNLDDLSPEILGAVMDRLFAAGALDVFFTPVHMKKNRPGSQLSVLCESADVTKLSDILFRETSAFGLRMQAMERLKLARRFETVSTPYGPIRLKIGERAGEIVQIAPEFEHCKAAAEKSGQPLKAVYEAALAAFGK